MSNHSRPANFSLIAVFLTAMLTLCSGAMAQSGTYTVPTSITFHSYLTDTYGNPVTTNSTSLAMRFGIFLNSTRVWYAYYSNVDVVGGSYTVHLGGDPGVAQQLDPNSGATISSTGAAPITPSLITAVTSSTSVSVQVEVATSGSTFQTLTPNVPIASSLFALRAETVAGYAASQLAKIDSQGNIDDANGDPVISSSGTWVGMESGSPGNGGTEGPQGPTGPTGYTGATGQGFTYWGQWDPNFSNENSNSGGYEPYDLVTYNGSVWFCNGYPEQGEAPSPSDSNWELFAQGFNFTGQWNATGAYNPNDIAIYNGTAYIALQSIQGSEGGNTVPPQDTSNWETFAQGFNFTGPYNNGTTYNLNDVVVYNGSAWVVTDPTQVGQSSHTGTGMGAICAGIQLHRPMAKRRDVQLERCGSVQWLSLRGGAEWHRRR